MISDDRQTVDLIQEEEQEVIPKAVITERKLLRITRTMRNHSDDLFGALNSSLRVRDKQDRLHFMNPDTGTIYPHFYFQGLSPKDFTKEIQLILINVLDDIFNRLGSHNLKNEGFFLYVFNYQDFCERRQISRRTDYKQEYSAVMSDILPKLYTVNLKKESRPSVQVFVFDADRNGLALTEGGIEFFDKKTYKMNIGILKNPPKKGEALSARTQKELLNRFLADGAYRFSSKDRPTEFFHTVAECLNYLGYSIKAIDDATKIRNDFKKRQRANPDLEPTKEEREAINKAGNASYMLTRLVELLKELKEDGLIEDFGFTLAGDKSLIPNLKITYKLFKNNHKTDHELLLRYRVPEEQTKDQILYSEKMQIRAKKKALKEKKKLGLM